MSYLDRTLQVKAVLQDNRELQDAIVDVFDSRFDKGNIGRMFSGSCRLVYEVGTLALPEGEIPLLLKRGINGMELDFVLKENVEGQLSTEIDYFPGELGLFDLYFDYLNGDISTVSFTDEGYKEYLRRREEARAEGVWGVEMLDQHLDIKKAAHLLVNPGDLGAVPYFHLVVTKGDQLGLLTEGLPPLVRPHTSYCDDNEHTMEGGRIIDLYPPFQSRLMEPIHDVDGGCGPDYLGIMARGRKYLLPENRLDI